MKLLLALAVICLSACTKEIDSDCKGTAKKDAICTLEFDPVCGCDGETYSNPCVADAAGVKHWTKGECKK